MEGDESERTPLFYLSHAPEHTPRPSQTLGLTVLTNALVNPIKVR